MTAPAVADALASNVARLRDERHWTQGDLARELTKLGSPWSRQSIGMLESKGIRAERLSDLVMLCMALNASLTDLLTCDGDLKLRGGPTLRQDHILDALAGGRGRPIVDDPTPHVGMDDAAEMQRLQMKWDMSSEELREAVRHLAGPRATPVTFRDFLGKVYPPTPRRAAQAKRGHGTRQLGHLLHQFPGGVAGRPVGEYENEFIDWLEEVTGLGND